VPELPEVETVRRTLAPVIGARVARVWGSGMPLHLNRPVDLDAVRAAAVGAAVERIDRIGKYLLLYFAGRDGVAVVHLGMTGRLRVFAPGAAAVPHTHVVWELADGRSLRFSDARRFGFVGTACRDREREHPALAGLGLDPLVDGVSGQDLHRLARGSRQPLKVLLLDQRKVAGIGNIYASEALWAARIAPGLRAHRLSAARAQALAKAVHATLQRALGHGGTSLRDFVNATGTPGDYRQHLRVYDREGLRCPRRGCGASIQRTVSQGRATFYCPRCQQR
jgi:formamidopyrimidine-DNA glycosylase